MLKEIWTCAHKTCTKRLRDMACYCSSNEQNRSYLPELYSFAKTLSTGLFCPLLPCVAIGSRRRYAVRSYDFLEIAGQNKCSFAPNLLK